MEKGKFKVGDWVFCEFVLQQVKEMEGDFVTSVVDGSFQLSGSNLTDRCYHLDLRIKRISDTVAFYSKRFHELKINSLNYPDLNRELIRRWVEMCDSRNDDKVLKGLYDSLSEFSNNICNKVQDLRYEEVEGIRLFRQ